MSTAIDPYQAWLNIATDGHTLDHYRLLGLNPYEADATAIRQGAERQMSHVESHAHKSDAATARRLSDEIAEARTCLLSPPDKARYDAQLRKKPLAAAPVSALDPPATAGTPSSSDPPTLSGSPATPIPTASKAPMMAVPVSATGSTTDSEATGRSATTWLRLARMKQRVSLPIVVGGVLSVLALVTIAMVLLSRDRSSNEHAGRNEKQQISNVSGGETPRPANKPQEKLKPKPLEILAISTQTTAPGEPILVEPALAERPSDAEPVKFKLDKPAPRGAKIDSKTGRITWRPTSRHANRKQQLKIVAVSGSERAEQSVSILVEPSDATPVVKADPAEVDGVTEPPADPEPPQPVAKIVRTAIPDAAQLVAARKLATRVYAARLAAATADEDRQAVAQTMVDSARDPSTKSAERYVLLERGIELLGSSGATVEGIAAVDELATRFEIDAIAEKAKLFETVFASRDSRSAPGARRLSLAAIKMANEAAKVDRYEDAIAALRLANSASRRVADHDLSRAALNRKAELESLQSQFEPVRKARGALAQNPDDPEANLYAGRWFAFVQGDWEQGLPMLKRGSNELLRSIAMEELANPQQPETQAALADRWWDLSQMAKGQTMRDQIQTHAVDWYKKALPGLTGLSAQAAQQHIDQFDSAGDSGTSEPRDDESRE